MDHRKMLEDQHIPLAELLGIRFLSAEPERVTAELAVHAEICTVPAILHGGAIMAFADTLGACATMLNLPKGAGTTTLESKTNFLAGAPVGSKVIGECTPIHRGRSTMVWQTRITLESGKLCAIVTQTQMVLQPRG
ncbi:MAG: PaaI family thioesterase [Candidatus Binataceae bacterium]